MEIKASMVYALKGSRDQADFVRVDESGGEIVVFHPMAGGFQIRCKRQKFLEDFEHVTDERMQEVLRSYRRIAVDTESLARGIPAWSNGTLWNGWQVPYFEREEIEKAVSDGTLDNHYTKVVLLDDAVLEVLSVEGRLPEGYDWSAIVDELRNGGEVYERNIGGCLLEAHLCRGIEILVEGRKTTVFPVGDGWCWQVAEGPAPLPEVSIP